MRELPEPEGYLCDWGNDSYGLPRIIVYYGEPGSATADDWNESPKVHRNTPIFTRDQVLAIQKQAYEDGLRAVSETPCADDFHNPWEESLENCINGDNYLRSSEYRDLIEELDDLYRMRAVLAMLAASQKDQK